MANTHTNLNSLFTDIANSIRNKTKDTSTIKADNFPDAIDSISGGETCSLYRANDDGSFDSKDICFTTTDGEVKDLTYEQAVQYIKTMPTFVPM